jgi:hypothetical protein
MRESARTPLLIAGFGIFVTALPLLIHLLNPNDPAGSMGPQEWHSFFKDLSFCTVAVGAVAIAEGFEMLFRLDSRRHSTVASRAILILMILFAIVIWSLMTFAAALSYDAAAAAKIGWLKWALHVAMLATAIGLALRLRYLILNEGTQHESDQTAP